LLVEEHAHIFPAAPVAMVSGAHHDAVPARVIGGGSVAGPHHGDHAIAKSRRPIAEDAAWKAEIDAIITQIRALYPRA